MGILLCIFGPGDIYVARFAQHFLRILNVYVHAVDCYKIWCCVVLSRMSTHV